MEQDILHSIFNGTSVNVVSMLNTLYRLVVVGFIIIISMFTSQQQKINNQPLATLSLWLNEKSRNGSVVHFHCEIFRLVIVMLPFQDSRVESSSGSCLSMEMLEQVFGDRMSFLTSTSLDSGRDWNLSTSFNLHSPYHIYCICSERRGSVVSSWFQGGEEYEVWFPLEGRWRLLSGRGEDSGDVGKVQRSQENLVRQVKYSCPIFLIKFL